MKTLAIISLLIVVIVCADEKKYGPEDYEGDILRRFPGYFHTEEEIQSLTLELNKARSVESGTLTDIVTYQACCSSIANYTTYDYISDINKKKVKLVKFTDRMQYFLRDICMTSQSQNSCSCNCTCHMVPQLFTALVESTGGIMLTYFTAGSICRCINNAPPTPTPHTQDTTPTGLPDTEL